MRALLIVGLFLFGAGLIVNVIGWFGRPQDSTKNRANYAYGLVMSLGGLAVCVGMLAGMASMT